MLIRVGKRIKNEEKKGRKNYRMGEKEEKKKGKQNMLSPWVKLVVCAIL